MIKDIKQVQVALHAPEACEINILASLMSTLADTFETSEHAERNAQNAGVKLPEKQMHITVPVKKAIKMYTVLRSMGFMTACEVSLETESNDKSFQEEVENYQGFHFNETGTVIYDDAHTAVINGAHLHELSEELREEIDEERFEKLSSRFRPDSTPEEETSSEEE